MPDPSDPPRAAGGRPAVLRPRAPRSVTFRPGRRPGPTILAVVVLGLAIGLTTTMFSVLEGYFLRPLPFAAADRLVRVQVVDPETGGERVPPSPRQVARWREAARSFDGLAAWRGVGMTVSGGDAPAERLNGAYVTADLLALLQVAPARGRGLEPGDGLAGADPVVVIGEALWRRLLGADPEVLGRTLRLHGAPATVVGVMPEGFRFPLNQDFWLPLALDPLDDRPQYGLQVLGRLAPGASRARARAELAALAAHRSGAAAPPRGEPERRAAGAHPAADAGGAGGGAPPIRVAVRPYVEAYTDPELRANLWALQGAVLAVLLVACANVAGLLLARGAARAGELAVRQALGAGRLRLMGLVLGDALRLAAGGGLLGLLLAAWGAAVLDRHLQPHLLSFWIDIHLDPRVLLFTVTVVALAACLAGLAPALALSRPQLVAALKGRAAGLLGPGRSRLPRLLVVAQVAACCALLAGSGLALRSLGRLDALDHGFAPEGVLAAGLSLPPALYPDHAARLRLAGQLEARLAAVPGVEAVAFASSLPVERTPELSIEAEGGAEGRPARVSCQRAVVSPHYFAALGVAPLAGRVFEATDAPASPPVAVISSRLAERLFGPAEALGRRVRFAPTSAAGETWLTVVGVVPDLGSREMPERARGFLPVLAGGRAELLAWAYVPLAQRPAPWMTLLVRAGRDPLALAPRVRAELAAVDADLALAGTTTLDRELADQTWDYRLFGAVLVVFAAVALALAAVGLYGVVSLAVERRKREIGLRMALGASRREVFAQVVGGGLSQLLVGLALGAGLAWGLARALAGLIYGVPPWDPLAWTAVVLVLLAAGLLACWLPARRAAAVEPVEALAADG